MKKSIVILLLALCSSLQAQNPTYQQKLFWTCKVWGFVKYYHSNVSICGVNWDSVLIADLPLIKSAVTKNDFNNALDTMLNAAGPMALTFTPPCDTMAPELKRNLNFAWINDSTFLRHDIITILDTINNNFRPHTECWVENNNFSTSYRGDLIFPYDSVLLNQNFSINFPNEWQRLMVLFKHWNIVNYFTFNLYLHDTPWDSTLMQNVIGIDTASNNTSFFITFMRFVGSMDDSHAQAFTYNSFCSFPYGGSCMLPFVINYIPGNYVVTKSYRTDIVAGDIINSINGMTTRQWEDSLKPYMSNSDSSSTRQAISLAMESGKCAYPATVIYTDSLSNTHTLVLDYNLDFPYFNNYYPNDSLADSHWRYWNGCNVIYVNVGQIQTTDETALFSMLYITPAVIFDVRNYPSSYAIWDIINEMFPYQMNNAEFTLPDVTYPGTWFWGTQTSGVNGNPTPYRGKVIILMNQVTGSQAEYVCQTLDLMPGAVKVGSQTWGADGNVTYYYISQGIETGFTTLGWFLPNGDSTQRIGIIPDSIVYPTSAGLRHKRDEVLEKALQIIGCPTSVPIIEQSKSGVEIFPNPSSTKVTFKMNSGENNYLKVLDVTGREIETLPILNNEIQIDVPTFSAGIYFYEILDKSNTIVDRGKFSVVK